MQIYLSTFEFIFIGLINIASFFRGIKSEWKIHRKSAVRGIGMMGYHEMIGVSETTNPVTSAVPTSKSASLRISTWQRTHFFPLWIIFAVAVMVAPVPGRRK